MNERPDVIRQIFVVAGSEISDSGLRTIRLVYVKRRGAIVTRSRYTFRNEKPRKNGPPPSCAGPYCAVTYDVVGPSNVKKPRRYRRIAFVYLFKAYYANRNI